MTVRRKGPQEIKLQQIGIAGMRDNLDPQSAAPDRAKLLQNCYPRIAKHRAAIVGRPGFELTENQRLGQGEIQEVGSGLIVLDRFNRVDGAPGNNWTEYVTGGQYIDLVNNYLENDESTLRSLLRDNEVLPASVICQVNGFLGSTNGSIVTVGVRFNPGADPGGMLDGYAAEMQRISPGTNRWNLYSRSGGLLDWIEQTTVDPPVAQSWGTVRIVCEVSGADLLVRMYQLSSIASSEDVSSDLTLTQSHTDTTPYGPGSPYEKFGVRLLGPPSTPSRADYFFLCGRNITVNGIPAGFKAQIDNRTPVVETGGSVVFNVDSWALPAQTVKLLNPSDGLVDQQSPAGGIWGGSTFTFV